MLSDNFKEKYKPIHVLFIGPIIAFILAIVSLLIAPYVELHQAHLAALLLFLLGIGVSTVALVGFCSNGPDRWD